MLDINEKNEHKKSKSGNFLDMISPEAQIKHIFTLQSNQFPDLLQKYPTEQCLMLFGVLSELNDLSLVNKPGLGGFTPLHWMCIRNELELIEFLIVRCKANVNAKANLGETPLFISIKSCNIYAIDLLIKHGADYKARDIYSRSIAHWTAFTGKVVIFHYFQTYNMINDLDDLDHFQQNPLHIACGSGHADLVKYLLDTGEINIYAKDNNGNTCLHMAVKSGLVKSSWLITQQHSGEASRLINIANFSNQTPIQLIKEDTYNHRILKKWLLFEIKTNENVLKKYDELDLMEKRVDSSYNVPSSNKPKHFLNFKWNSKSSMLFEYYKRLVMFGLLILLPFMLNMIIFSKNSTSVFQGLIGHSGLILVAWCTSSQSHRIDHISGLQNPYFIGIFLAIFLFNYVTHFGFIIDSFNLLRPYDFFVIVLALYNGYIVYKLLNSNPGFTKESFKKPNGSPYELKDLMKLNWRDGAETTKDSANWLTRPTNTDNKSQYQAQVYFCEHCLIIQSVPAKHCKLCDGCCLKFDHHCIYVNKCIGLRNHLYFILFLTTGLILDIMLIYEISLKLNSSIKLVKSRKDYTDWTQVANFLFTSKYFIWMNTMLVINILGVIFVIRLLLAQLNSISLGHTSQFPAPNNFTQFHKRMKTYLSAIVFRLTNIYTLCCGTLEEYHNSYFREQKEYFMSLYNSSNKVCNNFGRLSDL